MSEYVQAGHDYFESGHNCAQAVFLPFAKKQMDEKLASKLSSGFGGGIGGMRMTCGALCGAIMAAGLFAGQEGVNKEMQDRERALVVRLNDAFVAEFGTTECKLLLQQDADLPEPADASRPCGKYVRFCAGWIASEFTDD